MSTTPLSIKTFLVLMAAIIVGPIFNRSFRPVDSATFNPRY
jgi:hypothetical protein